MARVAEGLFLGIASGPACLASCLPAVLPWLTTQQQRSEGPLRLLAPFLAGRLAGYLGFAALAWSAGLLIPAQSGTRALIYGLAHAAVATLLILEFRRSRHACTACPGCGAAPRSTRMTPAALGLVTGLNLCPPFIAAAVRAADAGSLAGSMLFFALFFVGTTAWFLPLVGIKWLPHSLGLLTVARFTLLLMACYFSYLALLALGGLLLHG